MKDVEFRSTIHSMTLGEEERFRRFCAVDDNGCGITELDLKYITMLLSPEAIRFGMDSIAELVNKLIVESGIVNWGKSTWKRFPTTGQPQGPGRFFTRDRYRIHSLQTIHVTTIERTATGTW